MRSLTLIYCQEFDFNPDELDLDILINEEDCDLNNTLTQQGGSQGTFAQHSFVSSVVFLHHFRFALNSKKIMLKFLFLTISKYLI